MRLELVDHLCRLINLFGQQPDRLRGLPHRGVACVRFLICLACGCRCRFGASGYLFDRRRHFGYCRGNLLGLLLLPAYPFLTLLTDGREFTGSLLQLSAGILHLDNDPLDVIHKRVECGGQAAHLIMASLFESFTEISVSTGYILQRTGCHFQRGAYASLDQECNRQQQQQRNKCDTADHRCASPEKCIHIVHIDARANDPAPGSEPFDIGDLGNRLFRSGLGPKVWNNAFAVGLHHLNEFAEYSFTR